jgi:fructokinase
MGSEERIIAAVEGGGTSFVVAVAKLVPHSSTPQILHRVEVDSSHDQPSKTLSECAEFLREHQPPQGYSALGIATFGPVGLDPSRTETYGRILGSSPKKSWRNVDFLTPLSEACHGSSQSLLPVKIETDVNAPAFAEYLLEKDNLSSVAYITVGTGIGVGLVIHGKPVHGRMHPEGGEFYRRKRNSRVADY